MEETVNYKEIEQLLTEADDLLGQIDADIMEYLEEGQRIELEKEAQRLKELKSDVQEKMAEEGPGAPYSEGIHEAIDEITKALKSLTNYLSG